MIQHQKRPTYLQFALFHKEEVNNQIDYKTHQINWYGP